MDSESRTSPPDDERPVIDDTDDDIPVPMDTPFDVPVVDALEQERTVVLDDERTDDLSG